ncbi:MAG: ribonuclease domain-containing protein [Pseudonocardiaceae bacterium]
MNSRRRVSAALLGLLALVVGVWLGQRVLSDENHPPGAPAVAQESGLPVRALSELPPQTAQVWRLIQHGGPFRYQQDGREFENREGLLPERPDGFYHEYTVPTPGQQGRGDRRLVTGDGGALYYTADDYASVVVVDPRR